MSKTIYTVSSGNCDDDCNSSGKVCWTRKAEASKVAKEIATKLFNELDADQPGYYKLVKTTGTDGLCYTIATSAEDYACNWWFVEKLTLKG